MKLLFTILSIFLSIVSIAQNITGKKLLEKAIAYHDPNHNWKHFNNEFTVIMTGPNSEKRTSTISINLPADYFSVSAIKDSITTTYSLDKGKCQMMYNGRELDSSTASEKEMSCDRAKLYKNYYTYLYGLPMKLEDPGTHLNKTVQLKHFKGKDYLVLRVTYDESVGSDIWYFYFDPKTYAMEIYQFFKTDANGKEKRDTGEYILLSKEVLVNGIKMPKVRNWYYNKDDAYLGTDTMIEN